MSRCKMDEELRCQSCRQWFQEPVLLPCGHSICCSCASNRLQKATDPDSRSNVSTTSSSSSSSNHNSSSNHGNSRHPAYPSASHHHPEQDDSATDVGSTVSEADSGVVLSRPASYLSSSSLGSLLPGGSTVSYVPFSPGGTNMPASTPSSTHSFDANTPSGTIVYKLVCRHCRFVVYLGESGVDCLPRNRALENIVTKYTMSTSRSSSSSDLAGSSNAGSEPDLPGSLVSKTSPKCQLCPAEEAEVENAVTVCEQCETLYCAGCLERCHPSRGPLAKHTLIPVAEGGLTTLAQKRLKREWTCPRHAEERLDLFCAACRVPLCCRCAQEGPCRRHQVHPLSTQCKLHKNELSRVLQTLSEEAKTGTEFIQSLKSSPEKVNKHLQGLESEVNAAVDRVIEQLEEKRLSLLSQLHVERDHKLRLLKEQATQCATVLTRTTSLLHFCVEMLKEQDPGAFMTVAHSLLNRAVMAERNFKRDLDNKQPRVRREFEMKLDIETIERTIDSLSFQEYKAPDPPMFQRESCSIEANSITVAWSPSSVLPIDFFTLEIDNGCQGSYKIAYRGPETMCTVEHLNFGAVYRLRVRAHNSAGASDFSDVMAMQTSNVSLFRLDPDNSHRDVSFSADLQMVTCSEPEDRVVLGSTGFSRGIHYWEFKVTNYKGTGQLAFGVARPNCARDKMLGSDNFSWSIYLNSSRSWFLHSGQHSERTDGGLAISSFLELPLPSTDLEDPDAPSELSQSVTQIGIRLDCDRGHLSYYLNSEPHGPIAFSGLTPESVGGPLYPALSICNGVSVTLVTGLEPPSESEESEESAGEDDHNAGLKRNHVHSNPSVHTNAHSNVVPNLPYLTSGGSTYPKSQARLIRGSSEHPFMTHPLGGIGHCNTLGGASSTGSSSSRSTSLSNGSMTSSTLSQTTVVQACVHPPPPNPSTSTPLMSRSNQSGGHHNLMTSSGNSYPVIGSTL